MDHWVDGTLTPAITPCNPHLGYIFNNVFWVGVLNLTVSLYSTKYITIRQEDAVEEVPNTETPNREEEEDDEAQVKFISEKEPTVEIVDSRNTQLRKSGREYKQLMF